MRQFFASIYGNLAIFGLHFLSIFASSYVGTAVHVLSLEDVIKPEPKLGFFRKKRKRRTSFRRR